MRKIIVVLSLVLILGIGSAFAFADSDSNLPFRRNFGMMQWNRTDLTEKEIEDLAKDRQEFHERNMEYRREDLKEALENKEITQEEYDSWNKHFNYMDDFHKENGFFGGCGGRGMGMMRGMGRRHMGWF